MQRNETESFDEYKNRQKAEQRMIKQLKNGRLVWDSRTNGTYKKSEQGSLSGTK